MSDHCPLVAKFHTFLGEQVEAMAERPVTSIGATAKAEATLRLAKCLAGTRASLPGLWPSLPEWGSQDPISNLLTWVFIKSSCWLSAF